MEDEKIWTKYGEEGEHVAEDQDGYESIPGEASGNREKVVSEKTYANREEMVNEGINVNREEVINDVFMNMLADDTMEDGLSKCCVVWSHDSLVQDIWNI